jgi:hypothetical protein
LDDHWDVVVTSCALIRALFFSVSGRQSLRVLDLEAPLLGQVLVLGLVVAVGVVLGLQLGPLVGFVLDHVLDDLLGALALLGGALGAIGLQSVRQQTCEHTTKKWHLSQLRNVF